MILTAPDGTKEFAEASKLSDHPVVTGKDGICCPAVCRVCRVSRFCRFWCRNRRAVQDFQDERQRRELPAETEAHKLEQEAPGPGRLGAFGGLGILRGSRASEAEARSGKEKLKARAVEFPRTRPAAWQVTAVTVPVFAGRDLGRHAGGAGCLERKPKP